MADQLFRSNLKFARSRWKVGDLNQVALQLLKTLTNRFQFSIVEGDLIWLERGWYVTHTGLVQLASRNHCAGIHTKPIAEFCDPQAQRWAFEATVYNTKTCRGFVGYGDADPSNVSFLVHGAEMRVAETRAVNRALRKAYGIGICSVEEIGSFAEPPQSSRESKKLPPQPANGNGNHGGPKVRDRLCQIHSPTSTRSQLGQVLRHRFLWRQDSSRCYPRAGRELRHASGRLGREGPQCPALPAQQLSRPERRCRMKRQITGLHAADRCAADQIPDGVFLVRVQRVSFVGRHRSPITRSLWPFLSPAGLPATSFRAASIAARRPCGS